MDVTDFSFKNLFDSGLGFFKSLWISWFGTQEDYADSVLDIKCIETLSDVDIRLALLLDDKTFSDTYFVALSDVPTVKEKMKQSLDSNESFVFFRFDVFDYYAEYIESLEPGYNMSTVHNKLDNQVFVFQTKYYEDIDILELETTDGYTSKLYKVTMDPFDTAGGGVTAPKPIEPKPVGQVFDDFYAKLKIVLAVVCVIALTVVVFRVVRAIKKRKNN